MNNVWIFLFLSKLYDSQNLYIGMVTRELKIDNTRSYDSKFADVKMNCTS